MSEAVAPATEQPALDLLDLLNKLHNTRDLLNAASMCASTLMKHEADAIMQVCFAALGQLSDATEAIEKTRKTAGDKEQSH